MTFLGAAPWLTLTNASLTKAAASLGKDPVDLALDLALGIGGIVYAATALGLLRNLKRDPVFDSEE